MKIRTLNESDTLYPAKEINPIKHGLMSPLIELPDDGSEYSNSGPYMYSTNYNNGIYLGGRGNKIVIAVYADQFDQDNVWEATYQDTDDAVHDFIKLCLRLKKTNSVSDTVKSNRHLKYR